MTTQPITLELVVGVSERIRDHLIKQKALSLLDGGGCAYRGANGAMCAVGCLISDAAYNPNMERLGSTSVTVFNALVASGVEVNANVERFLRDWQRYHDGMCSRGGGFSYSLWIKGNELHSPEAFHQFITKYYEKEQQSNERA